MKHRKVAKSHKHYVRGIIHNLSLQRWTDQEIADYLKEETKIDIARSTVSKIKNQIEKQTEKWYIELRQSRYKYIAVYKERLDSLLSYQKRLHEIVAKRSEAYPEIAIRAIAELHRIEISIFNLWKQLPNLDMVDSKNASGEEQGPGSISLTTYPVAICKCHNGTGITCHYECQHCRYVWCPRSVGKVPETCPKCHSPYWDTPRKK